MAANPEQPVDRDQESLSDLHAVLTALAPTDSQQHLPTPTQKVPQKTSSGTRFSEWARISIAAFKDGADFRNTAGDAAGYRLIVKPKVTRFTYAYNQLKNLGFAITPQAELDLHVTLVSPDGRTQLDKNYASGRTEGDT